MKSLFLLISMTQIALYVFKTEEKQDIVVASTTSVNLFYILVVWLCISDAELLLT